MSKRTVPKKFGHLINIELISIAINFKTLIIIIILFLADNKLQ